MEGHASISPDVLATYARDAALEVDGVDGLVESHLPRSRSVRISVADGGEVTVALHVRLAWGASFPDVGRAVQERVAGYLERMADLRPVKVDVVVAEAGAVRA